MAPLSAREKKLLRSVLTAIAGHPQLAADYEAQANQPFSGNLLLSGHWGEARFPIRLAWRINPQQSELLIFQLQTLRQQQPVLLADYVAEPLARQLIAANIPFFDSAGNGFIQAPPLYFRCTGQRPQQTAPLPNRCLQNAGLKILYQLLLQPALASETYREIASRSGVALGVVGPVLNDLKAKGLIDEPAGLRRRISDWSALHQLWEPAYLSRLRPRLQVQRCAPTRPWNLGSLPLQVREQNLTQSILLGGELAASFYCSQISPTTATLHVPQGKALKYMLQLRLTPDPNGAIDLVESFAGNSGYDQRTPEGLLLAEPLLVHAELYYRDADQHQPLAQRLARDYLPLSSSASHPKGQ
ncbi:MAG: hypothetical protein JXR59_05405 [Desulfuromonadaceae bacterium]|nr:hypothetical protein [Desulfuromonadaceae bacterium]